MSEHQTVTQADGLIDLERYDEARTLLSRRLAEDPNDVRAWVKLGRCLAIQGEPQSAVEATTEAVRLAPEDGGAHFMRAYALRDAKRLPEAEESAREAIRCDPEWWGSYRLLAEILCFQPGKGNFPEGVDMAEEAIRLAPEEVEAYVTLWKISAVAQDREAMDALEHYILRLDPHHELALSQQLAKTAKTSGATASQTADMYAHALAAVPGSVWLRGDLNRAVYRMLRGTRWLALLCLVIAGAMMDTFPAEADAAPDLPLPLATRLWTCALMVAVWGFGAWRSYRKLSTGVRLNIWSLARRSRWIRIVLGQASIAMFCALLITLIPWTDRPMPQIIIVAGLLPTLCTIWFDKKKPA